MRIAVTGVLGEIGRALAEAATARGHQVVGLDRVAPRTPPPPLERLVLADLTAHEEVASALRNCEAVVHLAAEQSPLHLPAHEVHNNNVVASYNVLDAAAGLGIRHVCLASSVNAVNGEFTRAPRYAYFPLDEEHPTGNEDAYSLSKWICEQQADSVARRHPWMTISSLRFHWVVPERAFAAARLAHPSRAARQLWGYTAMAAAVRACLLATTADFTGHERFYAVGPETVAEVPTAELCRTYHPDVPLRRPLTGRASLFACDKAERLLGWRHDKSPD